MITRALVLLSMALASSPCDGNSGSSGTSGAATSGAGGADGGACDPSVTCAVAIDPIAGDASKLCAGSNSAALYSAFITCSCAGACASFCADNGCQGGVMSSDCTNCIQEPTAG